MTRDDEYSDGLGRDKNLDSAGDKSGHSKSVCNY